MTKFIFLRQKATYLNCTQPLNINKVHWTDKIFRGPYLGMNLRRGFSQGWTNMNTYCRIQTLLRENVKFLNFEKLLRSCYEPLKESPMVKIWAPLAQRTIKNSPKYTSFSVREKYPKKIKNLKTVECIGISMQNYQKGFWISQIRHKILHWKTNAEIKLL